MNRFNRIIFAAVFLSALMLLAANAALNYLFTAGDKLYMVDINRACADIAEKGTDTDLSGYGYIKDTAYLPSGADENQTRAFFENNGAYIIKPVDSGEFTGYVKFTAVSGEKTNYGVIRLAVNILIAAAGILITAICVYIKKRIIKPFNELSGMPYELSKGHLTKSIKENKSRYFGKFIWGLDMLRETLETHKLKELALARDNKTLILSISHDIKTPLSAIKLYARALREGDNRPETALKINENADKIESFVNDIIKTSKEDFLNIEINCGEFYLTDLINKIDSYYREKLNYLKMEFQIGAYQNCLIYGDIERSLEAFENIIENALKYGDGKSIELNFEREENCCLVTVSNTGNTLPENELVHIFDSFWRGSNTKDKKGSGLGLYICRRIFTEMKGDIFAEVKNSRMNVTAVLKVI